MIGKTISHYKIIEKLGEGGMGVVYKAQDLKLNRAVALKFFPIHLVEDERAKTRFIHEAQAIATLQHPNIAVIYDFIESKDNTFIVMEYLEGETLAQKIKRHKATREQILDWTIGITSGLAVAHEKGIIHRDIKPENIMITATGAIKIMDFGVAKLRGSQILTEPGTRIGTLDYAAPELVMGEKGDHRSDIFSVGVVLYELLADRRPFQGDHDAAVVYAIVNETPKPLTHFRKDISPVLERLVMKMLEKKKEKRYSSVDELLADLQELKRNMTAIPVSQREVEKSKQQKPNLQWHRKKFTFGNIKEFLIKTTMTREKKFYIYGGILTLLLLFLLLLAQLHWFTAHTEVIDSIAVLPLVNLSDNPAEEYFADGMTDLLISNLAKIDALSVISRTSVMVYKDTDKSMPEVAQELNVDAIVEGTVLRAGDNVRITAQLIEAATDRHLWAESYERDMRDILALQSEVAQAIVREIKLKLTPQEQVRLANARSVNPEAYEAYLKGHYFWDLHSEYGLRKGIKYYEEAIEKDPAFANAYAGLAESCMTLGAPGIEALPPREIMPKAKAAAMQALKLDDQLAEAHAALGYVKLTYDWDWAGAEREFTSAIELNPSYALGHFYYSLFLTIMGRHEEAIAATKRALELDPLSLSINVVLGNQYFHARLYDRAIEHQLNMLEINPNNWHAHWSLGMAYAQKRVFNKAIAELQKAVTLSERNAFVLSTLGYAYGLAGRRGDAMKILDEVMEQSKQGYVTPFTIVQIYTGLDNEEQAFRWLENTYQERSATIAWLGVDPMLDSLRADPRFTELLKKLGLEK